MTYSSFLRAALRLEDGSESLSLSTSVTEHVSCALLTWSRWSWIVGPYAIHTLNKFGCLHLHTCTLDGRESRNEGESQDDGVSLVLLMGIAKRSRVTTAGRTRRRNHERTKLKNPQAVECKSDKWGTVLWLCLSKSDHMNDWPYIQ